MKKYYKLTIKATDPKTIIYIADMEDNLVQQGAGEIETSLLSDVYNIHFGLGGPPRFFDLCKDSEVAETGEKNES